MNNFLRLASSRKMWPFFISIIILDLTDQLQILYIWYLVVLLRLLIDLGLVELEHLIYPRLFTGFCNAGLLHQHKSYGILDQLFGIIESFLRNRKLQVVLNGKLSQEEVSQHSILDSTLFLMYINDFPDDCICNIVTVSILMILL